MPARRGGSADSQTAPRGRTDFFRLDYSGYQGYVLLDLTELSSYLPLVPCFEFGNASGTLFPCTEGRVRTIMTSAGTPRAGAFTHMALVVVLHLHMLGLATAPRETAAREANREAKCENAAHRRPRDTDPALSRCEV